MFRTVEFSSSSHMRCYRSIVPRVFQIRFFFLWTNNSLYWCSYYFNVYVFFNNTTTITLMLKLMVCLGWVIYYDTVLFDDCCCHFLYVYHRDDRFVECCFLILLLFRFLKWIYNIEHAAQPVVTLRDRYSTIVPLMYPMHSSICNSNDKTWYGMCCDSIWWSKPASRNHQFHSMTVTSYCLNKCQSWIVG